MSAELQIGSTVWEFDENRRVYRPDHSGPIFREHFKARVIEGETIKSWIVSGIDEKVSKKELTYRRWNGGRGRIFTSEREVDDACFVREHRAKLADRVLRCDDVGILRQIATLFE